MKINEESLFPEGKERNTAPCGTCKRFNVEKMYCMKRSMYVLYSTLFLCPKGKGCHEAREPNE